MGNFRFTFYRINLKILSLSIIRDNGIKWWCMLKTLTTHLGVSFVNEVEKDRSWGASRHVSIKLCVRKWKILIKFSPRLSHTHTCLNAFKTNMNLNMHANFSFRYLFCICFCLFNQFDLKRCVSFTYNFSSRKLNQFKLCVCLPHTNVRWLTRSHTAIVLVLHFALVGYR